MLQLDSICKSFHGRKVLENVSLCLVEGDFTVLKGPNGSGKSTLFDIISGKTVPDAGRIFLDGVDITGHTELQRAVHIGRLFQNTYLGSCSTLTIRENLSLAMLKGRSAGLKSGNKELPDVVKERFSSLELDFDALLDVPMGALSGGQRQMIAFIMTTLYKPKLLLLDEPTAALDTESANKLVTFTKKYTEQERIATLMIAH